LSILPAEIFSVGDQVAVAGFLDGQAADLEVLNPVGVATVRLRLFDDVVHIDLVPDGAVRGTPATEALRLAARVAQKAWGSSSVRVTAGATDFRQAFVADGFRQVDSGQWERPPGPFLRASNKASDFDEVYRDPLSVPWNFVPAEVEVYAELRSSPPCRLLDLGCGYGKNGRVLARWGHDVVALDLSHTAVRSCRRLAPRLHSAVGSVLGLPFADRAFDVVIDVGCLHCVPDHARAVGVAELARVLRPGGVLYSRIFKPRDSEWLAAQPFAADRFGLTEDAVLALFESHFQVRWSQRHPEMHFIRCVRFGNP
jgi:SAM-dependent methyltransferase